MRQGIGNKHKGNHWSSMTSKTLQSKQQEIKELVIKLLQNTRSTEREVKLTCQTSVNQKAKQYILVINYWVLNNLKWIMPTTV